MLALKLGEHGQAIAQQSLPPEVMHHAKRVVLDWFAATLPGSATAHSKAFRAAVAEDLGYGVCTIIGDDRKATARTAALVNGTASHVVEFDDIFRDALYHPGCPTIAAALALGEARGVDGGTFLRAVIAGYEISTRIGAAMQPAHYKHWHTTGTVGCFAAASASAVILGLDATRFAHALGTVGTFAAGLQQAFRSDTMSKPMHAGRAAEAGVLAALAAEQGMTGALDILEGEVGFGAATAGGKVDWAKVTDGLGERFNITQVTVKNHGCCGHTFAAIDGALGLQRAHGFGVSDIEAIKVGTYQTALDVVGGRHITTPFEGRFSLPFVVASALVHGSVRLNGFEPDRLSDPDVHALMDRLSLGIDPEMDDAYPLKRGARVAIKLGDGREFEKLQSHRRGDPEEPLSDDDLKAKFDELAGPVLGESGAGRLADAVWSLESSNRLDLPVA